MKKFYLTAFAGLAAFALEAAGPDISTLAGSRDWNFYSMLPSTSGWQKKKTFIEINDALAGTLTVHFAGTYPVNAVYDREAATLTFDQGQNVGYYEIGKYDIFFLHDRWNSSMSKREPSTEPIVASVQSSSIVFDPMDIIAIGNREKGYFFYGDQCELKRVVPEDLQMPEEGWVFSHTAEFEDGWHMGGVFPGRQGETWEVEVEKNTDHPNLYRIVNPYGYGTPFEDENQNKSEDGYIVFSVEDADFVTVWPCIYSGYDDRFVGKCYNYNIEGQQKELFGYTKEEILRMESLPDLPSNYDKQEGIINFRNVFFGIPYDLCGDYSWVTVNTTSRLTMPTDNSRVGTLTKSDSSCRWYDLQGRVLTSPLPGVPCIKVSPEGTAKIVKR